MSLGSEIMEEYYEGDVIPFLKNTIEKQKLLLELYKEFVEHYRIKHGENCCISYVDEEGAIDAEKEIKTKIENLKSELQ